MRYPLKDSIKGMKTQSGGGEGLLHSKPVQGLRLTKIGNHWLPSKSDLGLPADGDFGLYSAGLA